MTDAPRTRLNALPADRQAQLLDPAEAEFAAHGFAGASLNRVLARAGMSKGQAYHYIAGKADLYGAVLERGFARLVREMGFAFGRPDTAEAFWDRVGALMTRISATLRAHPPLAALAMGVYESHETRAALERSAIPLGALLGGLVARGQTLGAVRTDLPQELLTGMLSAMAMAADRWFAEHWEGLGEEETDRLNRRVAEAFRALAQPQIER